MNRVSEAIGHKRAQIQERLAQSLTTEARVDETRKALDMDMGEYVRSREEKALEIAMGRLTTEGQFVSSRLGTTPRHFHRQDAAPKAVMTRMFRELLERKAALA